MKISHTARAYTIENLDCLEAVSTSVLVTDMERGSRLNKFGLIEPDIESKIEDRPPRWCKVHSIGEKCKFADDIKPGDWILLEFNRWTPRIELKDGTMVNRIEEESILMASSEQPTDMHVTGNIKGSVRAPIKGTFSYGETMGTAAGKAKVARELEESKKLIAASEQKARETY